MIKPLSKLFLSLAAFSIGVFATHTWQNNSADKKVRIAIIAVGLKTSHREVQKSSAEWLEDAKAIAESAEYKQNASNQDINNINADCLKYNLSFSQCIARKEKTVREIESDMLSENPPPPIPMSEGTRIMRVDAGTPNEHYVFIETKHSSGN